MSGSNRGKDYFTLINACVAFAIFCLLLAVVWLGSAAHTERRVKAETNSQHYADTAAQEIKQTCGLTMSATFTECVEKIVEATRESKRSENDLVAQIDSAQWAFWILIISGLGTIVTGVGIFYVRNTLQEMQKQTKVARNIGRAQVRAYLNVIGGKYELHNSYLFLQPKIENTGSSPALQITINVRVLFRVRKKHTEKPFEFDNFRSDVFEGMCQDVASGKPHFGVAVWTCGIEDRIAFDVLQNVNSFDVVGTLHWKDVFKASHSIHFVLYGNPARTKDGVRRRVGVLDNLNNAATDSKENP
jgi:hypothetical protein